MYYVWCALIKLARDIVLLLYVVVRDCLSLLICHDPEHLSLLHLVYLKPVDYVCLDLGMKS